MGKEIRNKAESVRGRLFNIAKQQNIDFDFLLLRYFQERFLFRLSISEYADRFVLKGGLLLLLLEIPKTRITVDVDFLVRDIKNNAAGLSKIFRTIAEISSDDGVAFYPETMTSEKIKEDADYEGLRFKIEARLGQVKKQLQFDLGFGDIITPPPKRINFPILLDGDHPKLRAYPMETVIAEKFEAMVKLDIANSRMKDFYDIYTILHACQFSSKILTEAIKQTFKFRKTPLSMLPGVFMPAFYNDHAKQVQWQAFMRKAKISDVPQEFNLIVAKIDAFISPVISSKVHGNNWNNLKGIWE